MTPSWSRGTESSGAPDHDELLPQSEALLPGTPAPTFCVYMDTGWPWGAPHGPAGRGDGCFL